LAFTFSLANTTVPWLFWNKDFSKPCHPTLLWCKGPLCFHCQKRTCPIGQGIKPNGPTPSECHKRTCLIGRGVAIQRPLFWPRDENLYQGKANFCVEHIHILSFPQWTCDTCNSFSLTKVFRISNDWKSLRLGAHAHSCVVCSFRFYLSLFLSMTNMHVYTRTVPLAGTKNTPDIRTKTLKSSLTHCQYHCQKHISCVCVLISLCRAIYNFKFKYGNHCACWNTNITTWKTSSGNRERRICIALYKFRSWLRFWFEVGLGISQTNAHSQWNPVYKAFHPIWCCGNETIRQ